MAFLYNKNEYPPPKKKKQKQKQKQQQQQQKNQPTNKKQTNKKQTNNNNNNNKIQPQTENKKQEKHKHPPPPYFIILILWQIYCHMQLPIWIYAALHFLIDYQHMYTLYGIKVPAVPSLMYVSRLTVFTFSVSEDSRYPLAGALDS